MVTSNRKRQCLATIRRKEGRTEMFGNSFNVVQESNYNNSNNHHHHHHNYHHLSQKECQGKFHEVITKWILENNILTKEKEVWKVILQRNNFMDSLRGKGQMYIFEKKKSNVVVRQKEYVEVEIILRVFIFVLRIKESY